MKGNLLCTNEPPISHLFNTISRFLIKRLLLPGIYCLTLFWFAKHLLSSRLYLINEPPIERGLDDLGFESQKVLRIFIFSETSIPALGYTQRCTQWVPEFFSGVKWLGREPDHSPSSAEVRLRNEWSCTPTPPIRLQGVDRGNIAFTFSSYLMGTADSFLKRKAARVWRWPLTSLYYQD